MIVDKVKYNNLFYAVLHSSDVLISDGPIKEVMNEVIAVLGEAAQVDRCYLFKNSYEKDSLISMSYEYEWVKFGVEPQIELEILQNVLWDDFPELKDLLKSGNPFFANTKDISDHRIRETLEVQDIKSVLFTPIILNHKFWGYIGFDDCTKEREWLDMEVSTLVAISSNIASYIKRNQLADELAEQYLSMNKQKEFYESIFNNIPADIVVFDTKQQYLFVNKNAVKDKEIRQWLIGKDDFDYCRMRNKDIGIAIDRQNNFRRMLKDKLPYTFEEKFELGNGEYKKHLRIMHPVLDEEGELEYAIGYGLDITKMSEQEDLIVKQNEAISNSPDGIAILDENGDFYYMNKAHEEMFGYETSELIGKSWRSLYENDEVNRVSVFVFPLLAEKGLWNGQTVGVKKNGEKVFQDITLRLLKDGSLICITRDVSDLVRNMSLLEQTNQKLELAINTSNLGMWEWNLVTDELKSNDIYKSILGFDLDVQFTQVGNSWFNSIHPDDVQFVKDAIDIQIKSPNIDVPKYNIEYRIKSNQGKYIWVLDFGKVTDFDEYGKPTYMVGFILDITPNKVIEEQIRSSEKRYRDLVENLREVIFETDGDGHFTFLNKAWTTFTGYSLEETIGNCFGSFMVEPKNMELIHLWIDSEEINYHIELELLNKKGNRLWFDVEMNKVLNEYNELKGLVGSIENITKRKIAESELRTSLKKGKQLGHLKSRFVGMASHEFRNPLAGIRSSAELMKMRIERLATLKSIKEAQDLQGTLDNIIHDVDRINSLMKDVLLLGSIETAKIPFHPIEGDLADFVKKYLEKEAKSYSINHALVYHSNVKENKVRFDPKLLLHVFNNILSNACKYSEPYTVVEVKVLAHDKVLEVIFSDKGIGIPDTEMPFILESFFRSSNVENIPGTGLGLSIAKYFMHMHGGRIHLKSKVGIGTNVSLEFPMVET
ncbi:MAG: PAS domain S-box protein [Bacteroidia bacterium]|nr:PAS domain S-box protein [Bacteroidia bacterium]